MGRDKQIARVRLFVHWPVEKTEIAPSLTASDIASGEGYTIYPSRVGSPGTARRMRVYP